MKVRGRKLFFEEIKQTTISQNKMTSCKNKLTHMFHFFTCGNARCWGCGGDIGCWVGEEGADGDGGDLCCPNCRAERLLVGLFLSRKLRVGCYWRRGGVDGGGLVVGRIGGV